MIHPESTLPIPRVKINKWNDHIFENSERCRQCCKPATVVYILCDIPICKTCLLDMVAEIDRAILEEAIKTARCNDEHNPVTKCQLVLGHQGLHRHEIEYGGKEKDTRMGMRPNWHEYHMLQAKLAASRSTCNSRPQGAVLVRDNRILTTGYNGALPGQEYCSDSILCPSCNKGRLIPVPNHDFKKYFSCETCQQIVVEDEFELIPYCRRRATGAPDSQKDRACVSAHAEANAVAQATRLGATTEGSVLYCTTRPCAVCTKILVMAGIVRVFYELDYDDPDGDWLRDLLPMERLEVGPEVLALATEALKPETSRRRLGRTE